MFVSIIEEINNLISRIRSKILQNQKILQRLTEVTDQILLASDPKNQSKTYDRSGGLKGFHRSIDSTSMNLHNLLWAY